MHTTFKLTNKETGKIEEVQREKWRWIAIFNDETKLKQFDEKTGVFHQFKEIDQSKLHVFKMVSDENPKGYQILFNPSEMRLIHFYRRAVLNYMSKTPTRITLYIFGYEKTVMPGHLGIDWDTIDYSKNETNEGKIKKGRVYQTFMFIMPDGGVVITDDKTKVNLVPQAS